MRVVGIVVSVVIATLAAGQQKQPPEPVVPQVAIGELTSPVRTQLQRSGILGQPVCDRNGAVYVQPQFTTDNAGNALANSDIVRIDPDGSIARFSANGPAGASTPTYVLGHAVDRDGRVFLLTMRPGPANHVSILQLAPDSSYVSKIDLDRELRPSLFAVLPSGDFLVGGVASTSDKQDTTSKSVLWLFGADGSYQREFLSHGGPVETDSRTKRPATTGAKPDFDGMVIGDDNNIYVLQPGAPAKVVVFDGQGQKQRTLKLVPPPHATLDPLLFISNGRLIVRYSSAEKAIGKPVSQHIFRVYDAQTSTPEVDYVGALRGIPACVDNNDLVVLVPGNDGSIGLARASLR